MARRPARVTASSLLGAARRHLDRYGTTRAHLRRLLARRVHRSVEAHGGDTEVLLAELDAILDRLEQEGTLDDLRFARARARSLHHRGLPLRAIRARLRAKGVPPEVTTEALAPLAGDADLRAACTWLRKRRAGPFRLDPAAHRERDLARLARAGFSYGIAQRVLDADRQELEALELGLES